MAGERLDELITRLETELKAANDKIILLEKRGDSTEAIAKLTEEITAIRAELSVVKKPRARVL